MNLNNRARSPAIKIQMLWIFTGIDRRADSAANGVLTTLLDPGHRPPMPVCDPRASRHAHTDNLDRVIVCRNVQRGTSGPGLTYLPQANIVAPLRYAIASGA